MMQITFVDRIAMAMPWAGGLVPATMTYHNARSVLGFELWEAVLIGFVVEAIGFVTITTALDLWEQMQEEIRAWRGAGMGGMFQVALAGVLVYLVVVIAINAILDEGDAWHKITKGLMATFGLLGGLMVALRNQLGKRRAMLAEEQARKRAQEEQALAHEQAERERLLALQVEQERAAREFEWKLKEEKLRQNHEIKLQKLSQSGPESGAKVSESFEKVAEPAAKVPETFGKWHDWRKLPESERKVVATLESWEKVAELYGVPDKTAQNWLNNAQKLYGELNNG